jgi:hypothetical protein
MRTFIAGVALRRGRPERAPDARMLLFFRQPSIARSAPFIP